MALGQKLYTQYCASCHGADGKGNGPEAAKLNPKPGDLTQIAKKNGGKFPFYEVDAVDQRPQRRRAESEH